MGYIVFLIVAALIGVIAIGMAVSFFEDNRGLAACITILGTIVVIGVGTALASFTQVPTGYTGILTTFGKVEDKVLEAGFNSKAPWQEVHKMDNRVQKATIEISAFSSDLQEVDARISINYQINKENAMNIYRSIGMNYYSIVIEPNIPEVFKTVSGKYNAEDLISNRLAFGSAVEEQLRATLEQYDIYLVSAIVEDMDFSDKFTNAVESKAVATQEALEAQIRQDQMTMEKEAEAARQVIEAEAAASVAKIQAEADFEVQKINAEAAEYTGLKEAAKNKAINESLTGNLLNYYLIMQWNGKYPETYLGSDNVSTILGLGE